MKNKAQLTSLYTEKNQSSPAVLVLKFIGLGLIILSLSRLYLTIAHHQRVDALTDVFWLFLQGIRVDLVVMGYFFILPLLISVWLKKGLISRAFFYFLKIWLVLFFTVLVFMEVLTPEFIQEYDVRPDRVFLEYLVYPNEVFRMLWEGYKPTIFLTLAVTALSVYAGIKLFRTASLDRSHLTLPTRLLCTFAIVIVGFGIIRSSFQHRPFNPSMVYFSNDNLINSLVLNSTYSALYAAYNAKSERQASTLYGKMPEADIIKNMQLACGIDQGQSTQGTQPTGQFHQATYHGQLKNVVILLQESLGSQFVGSLGGKPYTPHLEKILQEGWRFNNVFATGTRSVRGIEAVFTGFSPGPSRSVVKLSKSQKNFFTIASLFKKHGYFTQFIYGGESHFDNMKSFFLGNGIDEVKDLATFDNPKFVGSWGASDEDLYEVAHKQFVERNESGEPFFSLVFSTSNHTPWEFPESCNEGFSSPRQTRENAVRYADCALGKFIEKAKKSEYWENTLFLIIADHDASAKGSDQVPIGHFRIPAVITGGGIETKADQRLVSQLDFPVTLVSLAGISDFHPMIGLDLSKKIPENRHVMMQYGENFAWMDNQKAIVLRPNLAPRAFKHDGKELTDEITEQITDQQIAIAQANALWSNLAYQKGFYNQRKIQPETQSSNADTSLHMSLKLAEPDDASPAKINWSDTLSLQR